MPHTIRDKKIILSEGLPALVAANGAVLAPGTPEQSKRQYVGYTAKVNVIEYPSTLENDCLLELKKNFIKARTELEFKSLNDLNKVGITVVSLSVISDLDKEVDQDILTLIAQQTGVKGREADYVALLYGTACISQSSEDIKLSLGKRN